MGAVAQFRRKHLGAVGVRKGSDNSLDCPVGPLGGVIPAVAPKRAMVCNPVASKPL